MSSPDPAPLPPLVRNLTLVLCRTQGPVNLGMIARLCDNFGITDLRLVDPLCDINGDDARRFSTHAIPFLEAAPVYATCAEAVADCGLVIGTSARVRDPAAGPPLFPEQLPAVIAARPTTRWALMFGNEADGLNDAEMRCCQHFVRLRHFGANYAYNLSQAVAIMLGLLTNHQPDTSNDVMAPSESLAQLAPLGDVDRLQTYWLDTLEQFNFFRRTERSVFAPKFERLLRRMPLNTDDVLVLRSMLAQFNYRTFGNKNPTTDDAHES